MAQPQAHTSGDAPRLSPEDIKSFRDTRKGVKSLRRWARDKDRELAQFQERLEAAGVEFAEVETTAREGEGE